MTEPSEYRVRGRWVSMLTGRLCVHNVHLADHCQDCILASGTVVAEDPRVIVAPEGNVATLEVELATARKERDVAIERGDEALKERDEFLAKWTSAAESLGQAEARLTALELRERALKAPAVIIPEPPPSAPKTSEAPRRRTGSKKGVDE